METYQNRCAKCKSFKSYPFFKCPLGPASYQEDERAKAAGLDFKKGIVEYSWLCLICTKDWVAKLSEEYLETGNVVEVSVSPAIELEVKQMPVLVPDVVKTKEVFSIFKPWTWLRGDK